MMGTTETEYNHHQHEAYNNNWSCPESPSDHQDLEDVSNSEILDHGSISFGRFAAESLAWEKWSVFPHNRRQEELEQFKSPGLVAKKKAYFEEYYRKVRAMKALQAEQQETNQPDPCQDAQRCTTQVENGADADASKKETKPGNASQIQISDGDVTVKVDKSDQASNDCCINNDKASIVDGTSVSLSIVEAEQSVKSAPLYHIRTINRSLKGVQQDDCVADEEVKHNSDKTRKQAPALKSKGNAASAGNKKKLNCKTITDAAKQSEKPKPSVHRAITGKADSSLVSSRSTPKTASNNKKLNCKTITDAAKQSEKPKSSVHRAISGKADSSLVSSRSTPKAASNSKSNCVSSHGQLPKVRSSATVLSTSLRREKMVPSSSIIRGVQANTSLSPKSLADKLSSRLPVHARSAQCTSKAITNAGGLRKLTLENRGCDGVPRKSLELSGRHTRPKGGECENQRPKVMHTNIPAQNKSNQKIGAEFARRSYVMEGKQKEGKDKISAGLQRELKPTSSALSSIQKAPNPKMVHKIAPWRSANMMHDQREPRQRMPIWS